MRFKEKELDDVQLDNISKDENQRWKKRDIQMLLEKFLAMG